MKGRVVRALVYEKAHELKDFAISLREVEEPACRDLDVLVEVRAVGVNPGETLIRSMRSAERGGRVLLGWEFSGVVVGLGDSVTRFEIGDRVFGTGDWTRDGSWAERVAVDHRVVARIPSTLSFADAASLPIGAVTSWEAMFRDQSGLPAGVDTVLVVGGAGAVGSLATQLLKARTNACVISTASRPETRAWCSEMGADLVLDHSGDLVDQLAAAGFPAVDMVLSTAETAENVGWIANALRPFGHLSAVDGGSSSIDITALTSKSISLHTETVFSRITHGGAPHLQGEILDAVAEHAQEGRIRSIATKHLHGLSAEVMRAAHEHIEARRTIGKVVIKHEA
ncbi:zinc-binding alcohol dehydrogenase family protein [Saccharopolyspora sp. MS10]|uniref:zinc-binding alcohol dehydrogenase family protein n=1 Tax=Saccharopolyspora sp. MS10 TaxID=3385973 RepID=UPI00399F3D87